MNDMMASRNQLNEQLKLLINCDRINANPAQEGCDVGRVIDCEIVYVSPDRLVDQRLKRFLPMSSKFSEKEFLGSTMFGANKRHLIKDCFIGRWILPSRYPSKYRAGLGFSDRSLSGGTA